MTTEEAKAYAQKLLKDSGTSDEDAAPILKAFDNDKFVQGFVPTPEFSRGLDAERGKYADFKKRNEYLETEWLPQAKAAYDKNLKGIALLEKYQQTYGAIDEEDQNAHRKAATMTGMSEEKVRELLQNELNSTLSSRDRATLDLMEIREDHMDRFKKRMPIKEFEKHVESLQKSGQYEGLRAAYKDFIEPEVEKHNESSLTERIKREREEAVKDFASRNKIPTDSKPKEPHLIFDRDAKKTNGEAKSGRDAFLEVMNDPDSDTLRARYPV